MVSLEGILDSFRCLIRWSVRHHLPISPHGMPRLEDDIPAVIEGLRDDYASA